METTPLRIGVLGGGAVGCYFGALLARAGHAVTLIGRQRTVDAITAGGLRLRRNDIDETVSVEASTDPAALGNTDIVLLSVKSFDTETAARQIAPHLPPGALVLSLQNGVENPALIHNIVAAAVMPAVVYVAAEMTTAAEVTHSGRGDLIIGTQALGGRSARCSAQTLADRFALAGIPVRISDNIDGDAWEKLAMNCALNAISALARARYGQIAGFGPTHALMNEAVDEVGSVARATGVRIPVDDLRAAAARLAQAMTRATSSTAQDIARGKRTEIDALNGHIARLGERLGVPTPVNRALHALVSLQEQAS